MIVIIELLFLLSVYSLNLYCTGSSCTACISPYLLYNFTSCLSVCPSGYTQATSQCSPSSNLNLFSLNFFNFTDYSASSIDNFTHPTNLPFKDQNRLSPLPTIDRGFYFNTTSQLVAFQNWVLAPSFSLRLSIMPINPGIIYQVISSGTVLFQLSYASGAFSAEWQLNTASIVAPTTLSFATGLGSWLSLLIYAYQGADFISLYIGGTILTISSSEFRGQFLNTEHYIGGHTANSFEGFIEEMFADNSLITTYSKVTQCKSCLPNYYYSYSQWSCYQCPSTCTNWPWCTDGSSCSACLCTNCTSCSGYAYLQCNLCSNSMIAPGCDLGLNCLQGTSTFQCTLCDQSKAQPGSPLVIVDGVCNYQPTLANISDIYTPVIDCKFNDIFQYYCGIFQTGANASTYAPFHNPEKDDPFPYINRGLYFDGIDDLLQSTSLVAFNYECAFAIWKFSYSSKTILAQDLIEFYGDNSVIIELYGFKIPYTPTFCISNTNYSYWQYSYFQIAFTAPILTLSCYLDNGYTESTSYQGNQFLSAPQKIFIGTPFNYLFWKGFLYSLTIWQTLPTSTSAQVNICGVGLGSSCLYGSSLSEYFNEYLNTSMNCDSSCQYGCNTWGTCTLCSNISCLNCTNYQSTASCYNYQSECSSELSIYNNTVCCSKSCYNCFGPNSDNCLSCLNSYLLGQICYSACPLGFSINAGACVLVNGNPVISILMNAIVDQVIDTINGIVFSTGTNTYFYPNTSITDPTPAYQRGYYFISTSYMTSSNFIISCNFTMTLTLKILTSGQLLIKNNDLTISAGSNFLLSINSNRCTFNTSITQNWVQVIFSVYTYNGYTTCGFISSDFQIFSYFTAYNSSFIDISSALILGSSGSTSFTGFFYSLSIFNTYQVVSPVSPQVCSSSNPINCYSDCLFSQYFNNVSCLSCSGSCTEGCRIASGCNICDLTCLTCFNYSSNSCLTCPANSYLLQNSCLCSTNFYWNSTQCSQCFESCLNCSSYSYCTACFPNAYLSASNACVCNTGYYWNSTFKNCSLCNSLCTACFGGLSSQCTGCISNSSLTGNQCSCNNYMFFNGSQCINCDSSCFLCTNASRNSCVSCRSSSLYLQTDSTCMCSSQFYWNSSALTCSPCDLSCYNCSGSTSSQCKTCPVHSSLQPDSTCLCDIGYTFNGTVCENCYPTCVGCFGTLFNQCDWCYAGLVKNGDGSCGCLSNFYLNISDLTCRACDNTCFNCSGPLNSNCTSCYPTSSLFNGFCVCPAGYYWNTTYKNCSLCDAFCQACNGPSKNDCLTCNSLNSTLCQCRVNSYLNASNCYCNTSYYYGGQYCLKCDSTCLSCEGGLSNQCLSCNNFLLEKVCVEVCPIGYYALDHECYLQGGIVVEYIFDQLEGLIYDRINNVPAITGLSEGFYPYLDTSDPVPCYGRGIFFNGNQSFLAFPYPFYSNLMVFGLRFYITLWINPQNPYGLIIDKENINSAMLFSVEMKYSVLVTKIFIKKYTYSQSSLQLVRINTWNHVLIGINYDTFTSIFYTINNLQESSLILSDYPYMDSINSPIYIGKTLQNTNFLTGFIYSLNISVAVPILNDLITSFCNGCFICPSSGHCIDNCNSTSYYIDSLNLCGTCQNLCNFGCKSNQTCNLCDDINCLVCENYEKNTCSQCLPDYQVSNGICVTCNSSQYFDDTVYLCKNCPNLCETCKNFSSCLTCKENARLNSGTCECELGFSGIFQCQQIFFSALITLSSNNSAFLIFTEDLSKNLLQTDIISLINNDTSNFTLSKISDSIYEISPNYNASINSGDFLMVLFISQIKSKKNSLLLTTEVKINLFATPSSEIVLTLNQLNHYSQIGLLVSLSSAIGASFVTSNPISIFNFFNNAEIYSYIILYDLNIDPILVAFFNDIQTTNFIPCFFSYFIDQNKGVQLSDQFNNFGYSNSLILINSGNTIFAVLGYFCIIPILMCLERIKNNRVHTLIEKVLKQFKYGAFLRLWVQACLGLLLSCFSSIFYSELTNFTQIIDFIVACVFFIIEAFFFCLLVWAVIQRKKVLDPENFEIFSQKFGTFFDEFDKENTQLCIYYILFILRRYALIFTIFFIRPGVLQLIISFCFTLTVIFNQIPIYLNGIQNYTDKITKFYLICNEILVAIYYSILALPFISNLNLTSYRIGVMCIEIVLAAAILSVLFNVILITKTIYEFLKEKLKKKKVVHNEISLTTSHKIPKNAFKDF